jgi:hypothetical protein
MIHPLLSFLAAIGPCSSCSNFLLAIIWIWSRPPLLQIGWLIPGPRFSLVDLLWRDIRHGLPHPPGGAQGFLVSAIWLEVTL